MCVISLSHNYSEVIAMERGGSIKMRLSFLVSENFQLPESMSEKVKNGAAKIRRLN